MKENPFVRVFESAARAVMGETAIVVSKANLLYELYLDTDLQAVVKDGRKTKRGASAFQTDICIFEKASNIEIPRVVIEFKTSVTTHDILTYSTKAGKHKTVYPWLRYGLLASEIDAIPNRFFIHNEHLDFFIAAQAYKGETALGPFAKKLIEKELIISKELEGIRFNANKIDYYRTDVIFGKFDEK